VAQLIVRNLETEVKLQLQRRAELNGRSMEAEVREILREALHEETPHAIGLGTEIADLFRGIGFDSEIPEQRGQTFKPVEFEP
jgi:plasmid stability protein